LFAEVGLSVGYLLNVLEAQLFTSRANGFVAVSPVLHRFVGGLHVGFGYRFGLVSPFVSYALLIEAPFLQRLSPVLPHQLFQFGVRVDIPLAGSSGVAP
jgi:hypothetical protein